MVDNSPAAPSPLNRPPYKRKLIEFALPLQAINKASAGDKSTRHGHPSTLHYWWARRPLAACRAVLFASLVDDPSSNPEKFPTPEDQDRERTRLFGLIEELVQWDNSLNERVLSQVREEIRKCVGDELPTVYDPFCGGGAIPIEAQRLGLPTLASDLNPVAVLITKALTEIPWRFRGRSPVHPSLCGLLSDRTWERATGLAADVDAYGKWMLEQARNRIGAFYPPVHLEGGRMATVIAWIWARTVRCPNPLCGAEMPLVKSFVLSTKAGREFCIEPVINRLSKTVTYEIRQGKPSCAGTVTRRGAQCVVCNEPVTLAYIRSEGKAHRISEQLVAIVADSQTGRVYLPPDEDHVRVARSAKPAWAPDTPLPERALGFSVQGYGMRKHRDLFTQRQLLALTTFSDLVRETRERVLTDALAAGMRDDGVSLELGGSGATAYADAIATYLALVVDRVADYGATLCSWHTSGEKITHVFTRQTMSMVWDYVEANPFSDSSGNFDGQLEWVYKNVAAASTGGPAQIFARDAATDWSGKPVLYCTDPPYYDNVPYADLSDFFYVWLRASIGNVYPDLLAPLLAPKVSELVADPARFSNDRNRAREFFEEGIGEAFRIIHRTGLAEFPTTIYYAFKQAQSGTDDDKEGEIHASIGWEAMLSALLRAGFEIRGTWPITTELANRIRGQRSNALASSIVLVCRSRPHDAPRCTRADFVSELRQHLPPAIRVLRDASLAATDLEQAAIGPGMAIFSRYRTVLEGDGTPMSVRTALSLINQELAQIVLGEISEVDAETRFALAWFDRHCYDQHKYGDADILLKAKNANLDALREAGVVKAERGIVQLLRPGDMDWARVRYPDGRLAASPSWAQLIYVIAALISEDGGADVAAEMLRTIGVADAERLKDLAYHCYLACDRAKPRRSTEAQDFNELVTAWPDLQKRASEQAAAPREERLL
jgi:putative DNA methylase